MDTSTFVLSLFIVLFSARLLGELARALGAPSVMGELLAGILIGPSVFGWVELNQMIIVLAEFGVILLLFEVGLESDVGNLVHAGKKSAIVALGGFFAPLVAGYLVCYYLFDLPILVSLFVGGTLTATSIGITVRTLTDLAKHNSPEGQITLGAAVIDDVLGVMLLAVLYEFSVDGRVSLINLFKTVAFLSCFFLLAPILAKYLALSIQWLFKHDAAPGLIPTTIVCLVLFFAWVAHAVGAPELLGGFAAGLALSRRFYLPFGMAARANPAFSQAVLTQMKPIVQLFAPVFFVSVGLSLNLRIMNWQSSFFWWFSLVVIAIAVASKFAGVLFIDEPLPRRIAVGMAMVPRGEVGLIFVGLGSASGVFDNEIYTAMIAVIAFTTVFTPFWIKLFYRYEARFFRM